MAVRFTATGQAYTSTSLPPDDPFTVTCWIMRVNDRNAASGVWGAQGTSGVTLGTQADGTTLSVINSVGTPVLGSLATSANTWYKIGFSMNGSLNFHSAPAGSALTSLTATSLNITGPSTLRIGASTVSTEWFDGRIANVKVWDTDLSTAQIDRELSQYVPHQTANLTRWHPMLTAATAATDYSGNGRTLSGGAGATTEDGPPIPWSGRQRMPLYIPWDASTQIWYVVYDSATGELLTTGTTNPTPLPSGMGMLELLGAPPDESVYEWSTTARAYARRPAPATVDRIDDLLADGTLAASWASLTAPESTAMQNRIGQMLGPFRHRLAFQDPDLQ